MTKNPFEDLFGAANPFTDIFNGMAQNETKTRRDYTLRGDDIHLEPLYDGGKSYMKIHFPNNQVVKTQMELGAKK